MDFDRFVFLLCFESPMHFLLPQMVRSWGLDPQEGMEASMWDLGIQGWGFGLGVQGSPDQGSI